MPNWCYNEIDICGSPASINKIASFFVGADGKESNYDDDEIGIFGNILGDIPDDYNVCWYEWNCEHFGTKWDITLENLEDLDIKDDSISFNVETAWSPPLEFLQNLCLIYEDVTATIFYSESGMDFSGNAEIYYSKNDGGIIFNNEEYSFLEGYYHKDPAYALDFIENQLDLGCWDANEYENLDEVYYYMDKCDIDAVTELYKKYGYKHEPVIIISESDPYGEDWSL